MKKENKQRWVKTLRIVGIIGCVMAGVIIGAFWYYQDDLPPTSELKNYTLRTGSEVYDRSGRMVYLFAFEKRKLVSLKEMPPHLIDALIATEDKRFYYHFGVDPIGIMRAFLVDIKTRNYSQGASTITQQMARNMFLTLDKNISRKMREVVLAFKIEANFSKDEILEIYLNKILGIPKPRGGNSLTLLFQQTCPRPEPPGIGIDCRYDPKAKLLRSLQASGARATEARRCFEEDVQIPQDQRS